MMNTSTLDGSFASADSADSQDDRTGVIIVFVFFALMPFYACTWGFFMFAIKWFNSWWLYRRGYLTEAMIHEAHRYMVTGGPPFWQPAAVRMMVRLGYTMVATTIVSVDSPSEEFDTIENPNWVDLPLKLLKTASEPIPILVSPTDPHKFQFVAIFNQEWKIFTVAGTVFFGLSIGLVFFGNALVSSLAMSDGRKPFILALVFVALAIVGFLRSYADDRKHPKDVYAPVFVLREETNPDRR